MCKHCDIRYILHVSALFQVNRFLALTKFKFEGEFTPVFQYEGAMSVYDDFMVQKFAPAMRAGGTDAIEHRFENSDYVRQVFRAFKDGDDETLYAICSCWPSSSETEHAAASLKNKIRPQTHRGYRRVLKNTK